MHKGADAGSSSGESAGGGVTGWWSRSRANPTKWGTQGRAETAKARKEAKTKAKEEKAKVKAEKTEKKEDAKEAKKEKPQFKDRLKGKLTAVSSSVTNRWPWKTTKDDADTTTEPAAAEEKKKTSKETEKDSKKKTEKGSGPVKDDTKPQVKTESEPKKQHDEDDFDVDDAGFPIMPPPAPGWTPPAQREVERPLNVDDGGFFSPRSTPTPQPQVKPQKITTQGSSNTMPTDRTNNAFVDQIDASSTSTFAKSCADAASEARRDAAKKNEEASDLRRQASAWQDKGLDGAAEPLLQEAARLEETAETRLQAAAAYESMT